MQTSLSPLHLFKLLFKSHNAAFVPGPVMFDIPFGLSKICLVLSGPDLHLQTKAGIMRWASLDGTPLPSFEPSSFQSLVFLVILESLVDTCVGTSEQLPPTFCLHFWNRNGYFWTSAHTADLVILYTRDSPLSGYKLGQVTLPYFSSCHVILAIIII